MVELGKVTQWTVLDLRNPETALPMYNLRTGVMYVNCRPDFKSWEVRIGPSKEVDNVIQMQ